MLIIHGLADDNVVVAHTLRLSSALLAAGYPHTVLPLSGVTHMTPQEDVAENLLLLQVGLPARGPGDWAARRPVTSRTRPFAASETQPGGLYRPHGAHCWIMPAGRVRAGSVARVTGAVATSGSLYCLLE